LHVAAWRNCKEVASLLRDRRSDGEVVAVELEFLRRTVRGEKLSRPRYVESGVCRDCHSGAETGNQYVVWLRSRHAHAYWRLASDWAL
jgi:hypothetical protein